MLIDATHPEETRVVVVGGNRVEEFDFETAQRKQLRGNIYLAKVTRVEPSLQAAFVEYGGNRHGFLAFSEIHPDYYQIPIADRQALIEAEERAHREAEEENENRTKRRRSRHRSSRRRGHERIESDIVGGNDAEPPLHGEAAEAPENAEAVHAESDIAAAHEDAEHHGSDAARVGGTHNEQRNDEEDGDNPLGDHSEHDHGVSARAADEASTVAGPPETPEVPSFVPAAAPEVPVHEVDHRTTEEIRTLEHVADAPETADVEPDAMGSPAAVPAVDEQARAPAGDEVQDDEAQDEEDETEDTEEDAVESVGGDDVLEEVPERPFRPRRQYKIQEVIKRRQVMLVQVVKEERGNKGAALTTYLSLAGRYAVLMPNTARGGGISRKITSAQDRLRLKEVVQDLDVPEGMGVILRTAGASRTPQEIKRDFEYLLRLWETVRDTTLKSQAPTLVYEEGSLVKRSLRDLYNKDIDEILVAGEAGYREAHEFMKMLMPSNVRMVKQYRDGQPLFSRMGVESQLDAMFSPVVQLRSGGYIVINQTEALVSIDVNSGRATREHHIEDTALKTNLEAAEEVARQLRLRDLAGLIVIDFIDMDEKRNNRAVERKLSDCLRQDRARIQVGRISHFGLLEMSRQRIRASVLESSTEPCPQCGGTGHVRSVSSVALQLLRGLEETLMKGATHNLVVRTRTDVALYVLNHKRGHLRDLESSFKVTLSVIADPAVSGQQSYVIDRGDQVHTLEAARALLAAQVAASPPAEESYGEEESVDIESESEVETEETEGLADEIAAGGAAEGEAVQGSHRRRRRRRRGRGSGGGEAREAAGHREEQEGAYAEQGASEPQTDDGEAEDEESQEQPSTDRAGGERRPRRRGRRGGRRRRGGGMDEGLLGSIADEFAPPQASEATSAVADFDGNSSQPILAEVQAGPASTSEVQAADHPSEEPTSAPAAAASAPPPEYVAEPEKAAPRRSTVREKVTSQMGPGPAPSPVTVDQTQADAVAHSEAAHGAAPQSPATEQATEDQPPRRAGWWSRRFNRSE
ncbi:MAG: Rne/Rng family ribonuclease [Bradyrhizobium sp.]|nr:Rne/Rng family ribonuclease [Bradyrhizobium sp.]